MKRAALIVAFLAALYAAAVAIAWRIDTRDAQEKTERLLDYAILDFKDTIAGAIDTMLVNVAESVVRETGEPKKLTLAEMQAMAERFGVEEINIVAKSGEILATSDPDIGEGKSMLEKRESAEFMVLTNGFTRAYSQDFRHGAHNPDDTRKYLGVPYPGGGGYVQVGLDESRLGAGLYETILGFVFDQWLLGEKGYFLCADSSGRLMSNPSRHLNEARTLAGTGYEEPALDPARPRYSQTFEGELFGEPCDMRVYDFANHKLVAAVPRSEYYPTRNRHVTVLALALGAVFLVFTVLMVRIARDAGRLRAFYAAEEAARARDNAIAGTIQAAAMPAQFAESPHFSLSAAMVPAKEVGGDFYDFFTLDETHEAFLVADVSGKGTPAALYMMTAKTLIRDTLLAKRELASGMTAVNEELCASNPANMFITAWIGILDLESGELTFVNAGHNPPALKRAGGKLEILKEKSGPILAYMEGVKYRPKTVRLSPGDTLFLYTDGVTEAMDLKGNLFGEGRLEKTLASDIPGNGPGAMCRTVRAEVARFAEGASAADDLTVLAIKFCSKATRGARSYQPTQASVAEASAYLETVLASEGCSAKARRELAIVLDEVASNIVKYSGAGVFSIDIKFSGDRKRVKLSFTDDGAAYDPLARPDPDITLSAEERKVGGLGILMVKHLTDSVKYERREKRNILTVEKAC